MSDNQELIDNTLASVKRMQEFDVETLIRGEDLGLQMKFSNVAEPAQRLVDIHKRISPTVLSAMSGAMLGDVRKAADKDYNIFRQILDFKPEQGAAHRDVLTQQVVDAYEATFNCLVLAISFGVSVVTDFKRLEDDARATMQRIDDAAEEHIGKLRDTQQDSQKILDDVKKTAAEQGVSQQAIHFNGEAESHKKSQVWWLLGAGGFIALAVAWVYAFRIPAEEWGIAVANYVATKLLVFSLLAYAVFFCAKNYMAHRHNYVVNTHRQKALQTYRALVDATRSENEQDIVLTQAARCIFSPQDTGYVKTGNDAGAQPGIIAMDTIRRAAPTVPFGE